MEGAEVEDAAAALVAGGGGWDGGEEGGEAPVVEEEEEAVEEEGAGGGDATGGGAAKRGRKPRGGATGALVCQVPNCATPDLEGLKRFMKRYRICEACMKASELLVEGEPQRFCQQCGRFHRLAEFSGSTRSCKRQLELHNARRRKAAKGAAAAAAEEAGSASSVGHVEPEDADAAADAAATLAAPPGAGGFK